MTIDLDNLAQEIPNVLIEYGTQVVLAIVIFFIGKWAAKLFTNALLRGLDKKSVYPTISRFAGSLVYTSLLAIIITALGQLGIQTASFVAIIGAAGLAVGFALQGSLANSASGVMLILFRPIRSGDFIEAAGESGTVEEIGIFCTTLLTADNKVKIIPNANITSGNITNYSMKPIRKVDLVVNIAYGADIKKAKQVQVLEHI